MILDGKKISLTIQEELKTLISSHESKPGLAFILVGNNPASEAYVRAKQKTCNHLGIKSFLIEYPINISQERLIDTINQLNQDPEVHGILTQLPLPSHINTQEIVLAIDPEKDVDGFHPINVGKMLLGDTNGFFSCTPYGIKELLKRYKVEVKGKHVVILGRSNIVGKPLAAILMQKSPNASATVTVAHSDTKDLICLAQTADILVAAMGKTHFVTKEMVKEGAVVIDVGINRLPNGKLAGDVDFEHVAPLCSFITPVPGGIGPMTIAMLMKNTYESFKRRLQLHGSQNNLF